jgi:uncharacterized phage protein (TIGR01671 family)
VNESYYAISLLGTLQIEGHSSIELDRYVIQQYTGLDDVSARNIYESDIIQITNTFSEKSLACVVWDVARPMYHWMIGETWMLHFIDGFAKGENTPLYPYCQPRSGFNVTVVGNIYENPELLSPEQSPN